MNTCVSSSAALTHALSLAHFLLFFFVVVVVVSWLALFCPILILCCILFHHILFYYHYLDACLFLERDTEKIWIPTRGNAGISQRSWGEHNIIRIRCTKTIYLQLKNKAEESSADRASLIAAVTFRTAVTLTAAVTFISMMKLGGREM